MKSIKRTVIFSFYDEEGVVDKDTFHLLNELRIICSYVIIVINGHIRAKACLYDIADIVLCRQNHGMDGGAYKYVIFHPECEQIIKNSDELILCNNTFFGPFVSFESIFEKMKHSTSDFWGLTIWKHNWEDYIQSYFITYRNSVLTDNRFYDYWNNMIDENTDCKEAVTGTFERGLHYYLCECGYVPDSFIKSDAPNPYHYPYSGIKYHNVPILKKKCFDTKFFCRNEILNVLIYLKQNYNYDYNLIIDSAKRKYGVEINEDEFSQYVISERTEDTLYRSCTRKDLIDFIELYDAIYIYGAGLYGRRIYYDTFGYSRKEKFKGFIISNTQIKTENCFAGFPVYYYSEIQSEGNAGIIVALSYKNMLQVKDMISNTNALFIFQEK